MSTFQIHIFDLPETVLAYTKSELRKRAEEYIAALSTSTTQEFCSCEWAVHPDDADKETGRRIRVKEEDSICPLHTMEGRVLYFFEWLAKNG